jgi:hypothetical protein
MPAELVASVPFQDGELHVVRRGDLVAITDHGTPMRVNDAREMHDVLIQAADDQDHGGGAKLIGQVGRVSVVRMPYAIRVSDNPHWQTHSGWTMRTDQARALAGALLEAAGDDANAA